MEKRKIISLQIGLPKTEVYSNVNIKTAMAKKKTDQIAVNSAGIAGDGVGNLKYHGGTDRAICFYPFEHYALWNERFGRQLEMPAFGENLTVSGMTESQTFIGDIYRIGETVVQITQGRIPCSTISHFNREPGLLKAVMETSFTGYFARVIQEGKIRMGDGIELLEWVQDQVTVQYATDVILKRRDGEAGAQALLAIVPLAEDWRKRLL